MQERVRETLADVYNWFSQETGMNFAAVLLTHVEWFADTWQTVTKIIHLAVILSNVRKVCQVTGIMH